MDLAACPACRIANLFKCINNPATLPQSTCASTCGDGVLDRSAAGSCDGTPQTFDGDNYVCRIDNAADDEQCDTGGINPAACSSCRVQNLYKCVNDVTATTAPQSTCQLACGDGVVDRRV